MALKESVCGGVQGKVGGKKYKGKCHTYFN